LECSGTNFGFISLVDAEFIVETKPLSLNKCKKRGGDTSKYRGNSLHRQG
jgi:hypothetical protein